MQWLSELGITNTNRIRQHHDNVQLLAEAQTKDQIDQLRSSLGPAKAREIFWSWVEAFEFLEVFQFLHNMRPQEILPVLKRAVEGPADASAESAWDSSNAGRNFMFELNIAAKLARAGLEPRLGEPDVATEFLGCRLLFQCKRPFSTNGIGGNILKAGSQLRRDFKNVADKEKAIGIVAISVSKVLNQGDKIFEVNSRPDLGNALGTEMDDFWAKHQDSFMHLSDPRISGALVHLSTPTAIASERTFFAAGITSIYSFRGTLEVRSVLRRLEQLMRATRE